MLSPESYTAYEIIDSHTHIYPDKIAAKAAEGIGAFYDLPPHHNGSVDGLLNAGGRFGVSGWLVCSVATNPLQVPAINTFIAEQCAAHREFYGFGTLHPLMEDPAGEIARMRALGLRGIKLHPDIQQFNIDSPEARRIYEAAQGHFPILFHMGDTRYDFSHPRRLKKILDDFPQLTAIAAHLGGYTLWEESRELNGHGRVWFDTCSSLPFMTPEQARQRIDSLGVERCFFATDYPLWDYERELELLFELGFSHEENRKILAQNFINFIAQCSPGGNT